MIKIKAEPLSKSAQTIEFDTKNIQKVYYGRLDNCRCGCAGDYYEPGVTPKADRFIHNALNSLQQYSGYGDVLFDRFKYKDPSKNELYLEFCTETRTLRNHDEDFDYDFPEEGRYGYAFYIYDELTK